METTTESTPITLECYTCLKPLNGNEKACPECGCPVAGTLDEKDHHRYAYLNLRAQYQGCMQEALKATKSLYWISGLSFAGNIIIGLINNTPDSFWGAIIVPAIFIPLAIWSKKSPYQALLTATILYILFILTDAIYAPKTLAQGFIIKIIIITYLVKGIKAGSQSKKLWQQLKERHWIQPF